MNHVAETGALRDFLRMLRQRWVLVTACVLLAVVGAVGYAIVKTPTYDATATIGFRDPAQDLQIVGTPAAPSFQPDKEAAADSRLVTRDDVVAQVRSALGTNLTVDELRSRVTAEVQPDSNLISITANSSDPGLAAKLANEFAIKTQLARRREERARYGAAAARLSAQLAKQPGGGVAVQAQRDSIARLITLASVAEPVQITRTAEVPSSPASPRPVWDTIIAAVFGLIVGVGIAVLRESFDRRLKDGSELQPEIGMPLVCFVRQEALGVSPHSRHLDGSPSTEELDPFRILRTNLEFLSKEKHPRSVVVTSALPEEGKSTVACGLALASAIAGRMTLLVECDFRRPVFADRLDLPSSPGLSEYLANEAKPKDILSAFTIEGGGGVDVLPCIVAGENGYLPTEMLASQRLTTFLEQVTRAYELVVIDSAPLLPVGDTLVVLPQVDAALLCVRVGQTTRHQAMQAKEQLNRLPEIPTGLVVTGLRPGDEEDYYGYYA